LRLPREHRLRRQLASFDGEGARRGLEQDAEPSVSGGPATAPRGMPSADNRDAFDKIPHK